MKFEYSDGGEISEWQPVKVKRMNHVIEVKAVQKEPGSLQNIRKLSKTEYLILDTGEVKNYVLKENRGQNIPGLKHTFGNIRDLINNNFTGAGNELHLTLTYKDNMTDTGQLMKDYEKFWKRYKRRHGKDIDYLSIIEPQGRGAWHCHVLIRHNSTDKIYIPAKEIAELWGHGFIKVKALEGVDNIGAYLSAYLGDVELTPENMKEVKEYGMQEIEVKEVDVEGQSKAFIKGGRCYLYPPGMNLYRHSKGILHPEIEEMKYKEAKKIVGNATPNYSRTVQIIDDAKGYIVNTVTYEQYNMARKKSE